MKLKEKIKSAILFIPLSIAWLIIMGAFWFEKKVTGKDPFA